MKKKIIAMAVTLIALLCCGCGKIVPVKQSLVDTAMGTVIQQTIYVTDKPSGADKADMADKADGTDIADKNATSDRTQLIMEVITSLERETLSRRITGSEVWKINESAGTDGGVEVSEKLQEVLNRCRQVREKSGGMFDVSLGSVVALWNIDSMAAGLEEPAIPDETLVQSALEKCGGERIKLTEGRLFLPEGMQLDLGAVGKGIALEEVRELLQQDEAVTGAVISAGGSVLLYGNKPGGQDWRIQIVNPLDTEKSLGTLKLQGGLCVSTSGDYERFVEVDGTRYHHIINPATGYPENNGIVGVTVVCEDGFLSDALSTTCFLLGEEEGLALAKEYQAEVLFVDHTGKITMSRGMEAMFSASP